MTVAASSTPPTTDAWIRGPIEDLAEIRRALAAALQRWQADGPSTYRLTYETKGVDFNQITMDATVVDGVVAHADATLGGEPVALEYRTPQHYPATVEEVIAYVDDIAASGGTISMTLDAQGWYPADVTADPLPDAEDDEFSWSLLISTS